jgi:DNA-binding GntR family transcriptional regulator
LLVSWLDGLSDRRRLLSVRGWQRENRSSQEWQEHRNILSAVQDGDSKLAKKHLVEHIKRFSRILEP